MAKEQRSAPIGDEAVRAKTGKAWAEWFAILDRAGCRKMSHPEIVACLDEHDIGGWWQQMVTVGYEQARGLRQKHQKADGYAASASKTVNVPLADLYQAWHDARRRRWLPDAAFTVRKATTDKSLRITWGDGATSVEVNFYAKGDAKSQVAVQHNKLASAADVARLKEYWGAALARLKEVLEK